MCDEYYDADKIDIDCDQSHGVPSAAPAISSNLTSNSPTSIHPSASSRPKSSSAPSIDPQKNLKYNDGINH